MRYSDEVLRRVREPQRVGSLTAGADVGTGVSGTLEEGTVTRIDVRVAGDRIVEARFKVFGCSAAIASASLVAEWLDGASLDEARALTASRVVEALQLVQEREPVAERAIAAAQQALASVAEGGTK
ncbi:MAG: iron-sulfur cluster assembly scaffold protein [Acidobacteriota bacterium]|nr:iron-sulfur cluster assembly scaffold protein [Acidobacteriota bacterium]